MPHENPWTEMYASWPVDNEREARALDLLSKGDCVNICEETGMSFEEYRTFMKWAEEYEISHLYGKA